MLSSIACDDRAYSYSTSSSGPEGIPAPREPGGSDAPQTPAALHPTNSPDLPATAPLVVREDGRGAPHIFFLASDGELDVAWYGDDGWVHQQLGLAPQFATRTVPFGVYEAEGTITGCAAEGDAVYALTFQQEWTSTRAVTVEGSACADCDQLTVTSCGAVQAADGVHLAWALEHVRAGVLVTRSVHYLGPGDEPEVLAVGETVGFEVDLVLDEDGAPVAVWNRNGLVARRTGSQPYRASNLSGGVSHTFSDGLHIYTTPYGRGCRTYGVYLTQGEGGLSDERGALALSVDSCFHTIARTSAGPTAVRDDGLSLVATVAGPGRFEETMVALDVPPRNRERLVLTGAKVRDGLHLVSTVDGLLTWEWAPPPYR